MSIEKNEASALNFQETLESLDSEKIKNFLENNPEINLNERLTNNKLPVSVLFEKYNESKNKEVDVISLKKAITILHDKGADLNQTDLQNEPVWFLSALLSKDKELAINFLKASKPEDRPWKSYEALLYACEKDVPASILMSLIQDSHININETNKLNENALFFAASQKDKESSQRVFSLLHGNVDKECKNELGETALFSAVLEGSAKTTKLLLTVGFDPNACDLEGKTAISKVKINVDMDEENKQKVIYLIESGATLDRKVDVDWINDLIEKQELYKSINAMPQRETRMKVKALS